MTNIEYRTVFDTSSSSEYMVTGYASTFQTYTLFTSDGIDYRERILPTAFNDADMSDVVFRVDHEGRVYARTSADTLKLFTDKHGLGVIADLSRTQPARGLFEEIKAGNYPKMSFAFKVAEGGDSYDSDTHTRTIRKIAQVFDVSPVSFPANPNTELGVYTRTYFEDIIKREKEKLRLKIKILSEL